MHTIFDIDSNSDFLKVAEDILNNLYLTRNYSTISTEQNISNEAMNDIRNIIFNCNFNIPNVKEVLEQKKMDQDKIKIFTSLLENKKATLLSAALIYYNSSYGEIITDNEWILKLVFGTSELKTLKYSLLQIMFTTMDNKGVQKSIFDINKDILLKMIDALQIICEN